MTTAGESRDEGGYDGGRRWWREAPSVIAVAGLIVALTFNTIGVWRSVREDEQTRRAAELNLLTQLDALVNQAEKALNSTEGLDRRCARYPAYSLSRDETARLFAALQHYDYMAWLFNDEHITLGPAMRYWAPNMVDAYRLGVTFQPDGEIVEKFAELAAFERTAPAELHPRDPCRVVKGAP